MKLWRVICITASLISLFFWAGMGSVQAGGIVGITVDGNVIETDVPPFIDENSRTMVPVRFVSEALGCHVGWNKEEQRVRVSRPGTIVELHIDQQAAQVNQTEYELDTAAVLKEGRTMVPLRFLAETFGLVVDWNQESFTVAIKSPAPALPPEPRIATVNGSTVNIRSGPGTDHERLTQVKKGTQVTVLAEDGAWFEVLIPGGEKGWIASWLVEFSNSGTEDMGLRGEYAMPADATRSALVMKPSVNVRSAPGVNHPVIDKVSLGQQLAITGEQNNWFSIQLPDGSSGWIAGWLVAVRYDGEKNNTAPDRSVVSGLISRWSAGEQIISGDLPVLADLNVERSGMGVLLKITANSSLGMPVSFRMENPSRLVFDFPAHLGEEEVIPTLQANHGPVERFRLGQFNDSTVRIVADLQGPASYALSPSPDGRTITIQIQPVDPSGKIIVIDPGHGAFNQWGGSDPGAIGPTGLTEREVVQSISMQLGNILLNEGFTVIYTNECNTGLSLDERAMVGSISGAELLVSIHANASTNRSLAGTMTFYHAPWGSDRENQIQARRELAGFIQAELLKRLQREDKGVREANFLVLRSCPIPAALVEVAFISNPEEEKLLADPTFQRRAAEAIALGIKRYLAAR